MSSHLSKLHWNKKEKVVGGNKKDSFRQFQLNEEFLERSFERLCWSGEVLEQEQEQGEIWDSEMTQCKKVPPPSTWNWAQGE